MTWFNSPWHSPLTGSLGVIVAVGAVACGGEDRGRPERSDTPVEDVDYCAAEDSVELQPLLTFERLAAQPCEPEFEVGASGKAVVCGTYFNYDLANSLEPTSGPEDRDRCAEGAGRADAFVSLSPVSKAQNSLPPEPLPEARCGDEEQAFHFQGENVALCINEATGRLGWGAGIEVNFNGDIDVSAWDGFAFWIRKGSGPTEAALLFTANDFYTTGVTAVDPPEDRCSMAEDAADANKCDAFGVNVTLSDQWTFVRVPFDSMRQKGFGKPSVNRVFDPTTLRRVQVLLTAGTWDFWVDDISVFRAATP